MKGLPLGLLLALWACVSLADARGTVAVPILQEDEPIDGLLASTSGIVEFGSPVTFLAAVTGGSNVEYRWVFSDNTTAEGASVTHTFTNSSGNDTATVFASNSVSQANSSTQASYYRLGTRCKIVNESGVIQVSSTKITISAQENARLNLSLGDIFVGAGFQGLVETLTTASNGNVQANYFPVPFENLFQDAAISYMIPWKSSKRQTFNGLSYNWNPGSINLYNSSNVQVSINPAASFQSTVTLTLKIANFSLVAAGISFSAGAQFSLYSSATLRDKTSSSVSSDLAKIPLSPILFMIGDIPVYMSPSLTIAGGASFSSDVSAVLKVGGAINSLVSAYTLWTSASGLASEASANLMASAVAPAYSGIQCSGSLSLFLNIKLQFTVNYVLDFNLNLQPMNTFTLTSPALPSDCPCSVNATAASWKDQLSLDGSLGMGLTISKKGIYKSSVLNSKQTMSSGCVDLPDGSICKGVVPCGEAAPPHCVKWFPANSTCAACTQSMTEQYWGSMCQNAACSDPNSEECRMCSGPINQDGSCPTKAGCAAKYWGPSCSNRCPNTCIGPMGVCAQDTGACKLGCMYGYWGDYCDLPCLFPPPSNCNSYTPSGQYYCRQANGQCASFCPKGWCGITCSRRCA